MLCCRARRADMGTALSHVQEGDACDGGGQIAPPTMADVIRERKKKAGGAGLATLRRRIAAAARRPRDNRPDRGCEHARFIRQTVGSWALAEVFLLARQLEALAALRDLSTQAELARAPAPDLRTDLAAASRARWWCDVELVGAGWSIPAHRAILASRCSYFRQLLQRYPSSTARVPLDGCAGLLRRELIVAAVRAIYGQTNTQTHRDCERHSAERDLDIINVNENTNSWRSNRGCTCGGRTDAQTLQTLSEQLGFSPHSLYQDMRYLLDSREYADMRLSFRSEGSAQYGFRNCTEIPCHRAILAARSSFFRNVLSRRSSAGSGWTVHVDDSVLSGRFAGALLHAAYTDQVDLSLIPRATSSPSASGSNTNSWSNGCRGGARNAPTNQLEDAFQLYEIARFVEMSIVVQGCEDAIVEALSAETLPTILQWSSAPHGSAWVHRQAMRYFLDEFPSVMCHPASASLPRSALTAALASPFLQASESEALKAIIRWAERDADRTPQQREPNLVWHTAHSVSRRGNRRRELNEAAVRETVAPLVTHIRLEHIPADDDTLQQAIRRGIVCQPPSHMLDGSGSIDAWLGRGLHRPPRCFMPYLDELKALLEDQAVPEAEIARVRRTRYINRIPDTLYMLIEAIDVSSRGNLQTYVAAGRSSPAPEGVPSSASSSCASCLPPSVVTALRSRRRELVTAAMLHSHTRTHEHTLQIALRAVREMNLPDDCADILLNDSEEENEPSLSCDSCDSRHGSVGSVSRENLQPHSSNADSLSRASQSSRGADLVTENERSNSCRRRELPALVSEGQPHRSNSLLSGSLSRASHPARLCSVPDVALGPNANTHLLTHRELYAHTHEFSGGAVLQLDLGDGATHTPRPGSRAQRATAHSARHHREHPQLSRSRPPPADEDELRAAIELSVIRAYSSYAPLHPGQGGSRAPVAPSAPPPRRGEGEGSSHAGTVPSGARSRLTPSPASLCAGEHGAHPAARSGSLTPHATGSRERVAGASGTSNPLCRRTCSPRRLFPHEYSHYTARDYRLDPTYGGSGSSSRNPSPNNYA